MANDLLASPFDSKHYGIKVGKLILTSDAKDLAVTIRVAKKEGYDVLFIRQKLAALDHPIRQMTHKALEALGATLLSTIVHLRSDLKASPDLQTNMPTECHESITDPKDLDAIARICSESIYQSHLHHDPKLPINRTKELHAEWARNDATGRCQQTIVVRQHKRIAGFLTVQILNKEGLIDLVAVDVKLQHQGIGQNLVLKAVDWIRKNAETAVVGTQTDNSAYNLYQKLNFRPVFWEDIYHLWLK